MRWRGSGLSMVCPSLPAEIPHPWGKSQPCPRSLNFLKVQTSCQQSEQKYSNVQIVIHSLMVKMVKPLHSYFLCLFLLKISWSPFCSDYAAFILRLMCWFKAGASWRTLFSSCFLLYILPGFGQWLGLCPYQDIFLLFLHSMANNEPMNKVITYISTVILTESLHV